MNPDFRENLLAILYVAFVYTVPLIFYYLAIHRPGLRQIMETGEPPRIWRNRLARYGHTELSTRIYALMFLVIYGVLFMKMASDGFDGWCGFTGYILILYIGVMYFDHTLARAHLKTPIKLMGLSGVLVGTGLVLMWLVYWYVIQIPVKVYFGLNALSMLMMLYVIIMPMQEKGH